MNQPSKILLRIVTAFGLLGFLVGGGIAAYSVMSAPYVREFQAGASSPLSERTIAIVQRSAIEGVGFGALGLVLGSIALGLAALDRRGGRTLAARTAAWLAVSSASFALFVVYGTWFAGEALAFLDPWQIALVDLGGFAATLLGFVLVHLLVRRIPLARRFEPASVAFAGVALVLALALALNAGLRLMVGSRTAGAVIIGAACLVLALLVPFLSGERAGRLVPRTVVRALVLLLLVCAGITLGTLHVTAPAKNADYAQLKARGTPGGPNVVLVTIDTLRADHLGCYGYSRPTTPFLDSVAEEGTLFADTSAAAPWTKPATGTILTGLYPSRHGALHHGSKLQLPKGEETLAQAFRDAGYVTAGFISNPNLKRVFDFDRGFDEYFDSPIEDTVTLAAIRNSLFGGILIGLTRYQFNWKYENDVMEMNRHILPWLDENRDNRFFMYLHYIDPHIPYSPPEPYKSQFEQDHGLVFLNERKRLVGMDLYDGEIRYTDAGMEQLVGALKRLGIWDNTLFVLTADHGEEFFEHGVHGHGFSLYQPVLRVPLIFHGPGVPAGRVVHEPVQMVDLAATLLDVAKTSRDQIGDGHSFAAALRGDGWKEDGLYYFEDEFGTGDGDPRMFVFSGVREGPWKLVLTERNAFFPSHAGLEELYNLQSDPAEEKNLFRDPKDRQVVQQLIEKLRKHAEFLDRTGFREAKSTAISADVEANLKALGY